MVQLHFLAFAAVLFVGFVRVSPGPMAELQSVHSFEQKALQRTAAQLDTLIKTTQQNHVPASVRRRLIDGPTLSASVGTLYLFLLLVDARISSWIIVFLEVIIAASQSLGSAEFFASLGLAFLIVVLSSFPSFPFARTNAPEALRREIDSELRELQREIVEQIEATRASLSVKKKTN